MALKKDKREWIRKATLPVVIKRGEKHQVQCTTWKDKKQLIFLHTHLIQNDGDTTVRHNMKYNKRRIDLGTPAVQSDYLKHFNTVDMNDRNSTN